MTDPAVNILSGRSAQTNKIPVTIRVASTMSLVHGIPITGKQLQSGLSALINEYNRASQILERTIRLNIDNDDYMPKLARQNTRGNLDLGFRFFLLSLGSPTLSLDVISEKNAIIFWQKYPVG